MADQVSDFKVFDAIAQEGKNDGIAMFPDMAGYNLSKAGVEVKIGAPRHCLDWLLYETHHFVLCAVKKEDFARVKKSLENQ